MGTLNATEFTVVSEVLRRASLQLQAEASVKSRANQAVIMPSLKIYLQLIIQIRLGKIFLDVSPKKQARLNHFYKKWWHSGKPAFHATLTRYQLKDASYSPGHARRRADHQLKDAKLQSRSRPKLEQTTKSSPSQAGISISPRRTVSSTRKQSVS